MVLSLKAWGSGFHGPLLLGVFSRCCKCPSFSLCRTSQLSVCAVLAGRDRGRAALRHHWPAAWLVCQRPSGLQSPHSRLVWCCSALAAFQWSGAARGCRMGMQNLPGTRRCCDNLCSSHSLWQYTVSPKAFVLLNIVQNPIERTAWEPMSSQLTLWSPVDFSPYLQAGWIKAIAGLHLQSMRVANSGTVNLEEKMLQWAFLGIGPKRKWSAFCRYFTLLHLLHFIQCSCAGARLFNLSLSSTLSWLPSFSILPSLLSSLTDKTSGPRRRAFALSLPGLSVSFRAWCWKAGVVPCPGKRGHLFTLSV